MKNNNFRSEKIETTKGVGVTAKGFMKVFTNTNEHLPVDINVQERFGIFCIEGEQYLEEIHNFEVRENDVWVLSIPKSGTTWMLEMVWLLANNLDYEAARKCDQRERCRYLEYVAINPLSNSIEAAKNMKSPRVFKSHLPMHMLPKGLWTVKPKIIYVARDPKDTIVSYYHFVHNLGMTSCGVEVFVNDCVKNKTIYSPYWSHVAEFWSIRNMSNVYFTSFERMKMDLRKEILKVSELLEKNLSHEELEKLVEHLTFDKMKNNESCNNVKEVEHLQKLNGIEKNPMGVFIRKGQVGTFKEDLSTDLIKTLEDWTESSTKMYGITAEDVLLS